ncbi:hypothetical protein CPT_MarsHill_091 [Staphylococcus phage MarsHill]|nr:hypothetical protein CPT_MarsHill_091 [Staphylococcus phage MarsHill]
MNNNNVSSKINKNQLQTAMNNMTKNINDISRKMTGQDRIDEINRLKRENEELHRFLFKIYQDDDFDRRELKKIIFKDVNKKFK